MDPSAGLSLNSVIWVNVPSDYSLSLPLSLSFAPSFVAASVIHWPEVGSFQLPFAWSLHDFPPLTDGTCGGICNSKDPFSLSHRNSQAVDLAIKIPLNFHPLLLPFPLSLSLSLSLSLFTTTNTHTHSHTSSASIFAAQCVSLNATSASAWAARAATSAKSAPNVSWKRPQAEDKRKKRKEQKCIHKGGGRGQDNCASCAPKNSRTNFVTGPNCFLTQIEMEKLRKKLFHLKKILAPASISCNTRKCFLYKTFSLLNAKYNLCYS